MLLMGENEHLMNAPAVSRANKSSLLQLYDGQKIIWISDVSKYILLLHAVKDRRFSSIKGQRNVAASQIYMRQYIPGTKWIMRVRFMHITWRTVKRVDITILWSFWFYKVCSQIHTGSNQAAFKPTHLLHSLAYNSESNDPGRQRYQL